MTMTTEEIISLYISTLEGSKGPIFQVTIAKRHQNIVPAIQILAPILGHWCSDLYGDTLTIVKGMR